MGFTTPCFIRKNTANIRNRLKELGYYCNPYLGWHNLYTSIFGVTSICSMDDDDINALSEEIDSLIDCGTNEELFLAIASLRDDTDKYQWFIMDVEIYVYIPKGTWFQSTDRNGGRHVGTQIESLYCHKATVEELIEHFKEKEVNHG